MIEIICLVLVVNYNGYQRSVFVSSSNKFTGGIYNNVSNAEEYLMLKAINEELSRENAFLRSQLPGSYHASRDYFNVVFDSLSQQQYIYRAAKVINNSTNKQFNYITINKGLLNGIKPEMGVLSSKGVIGIVKNASDNYATIISVLNTRLRISAKIKETGYFGSLQWQGGSHLYAWLNEIPSHAKVNVGDLIVTSGYSSIFPENIFLGTVDEVELSEGESFYKIKVKLTVDFKNLSFVEVIENTISEEQLSLEKETEND